MMIEHPMYTFNDEIRAAFQQLPLSERFNDHNLGVKVVRFATQEYCDQESSIRSFIKQTNLGNRAVAKWFNWNKSTGTFNMNLIKERGLYDSNLLDREIASLSTRGSAILSDAGEKLIHNTYLIMSDICYKGSCSNKLTKMSDLSRKNSFKVRIVSYLFQLNWDENLLNEFYNSYYMGCHDFTSIDRQYQFTFRTKVVTDYGESDKGITQNTLIERVVARCLDINMFKLQTAYPDFRIKSPLIAVEPLQSCVGVKEGITPNSLFEVLEMSLNENGIISYKRVGIIRPIKNKIWDNRYMAAEEGVAASSLGFTTFKKVSGGDFFPGMLIREIKN